MVDKTYLDFLVGEFDFTDEEDVLRALLLFPNAMNKRVYAFAVNGTPIEETQKWKDWDKIVAMRNVARFRAGFAPTKSVRLSSLVAKVSYTVLCQNNIQHVDALLHAAKKGLPLLPPACQQDTVEALHYLNVHRQYKLPPHKNVRQFLYMSQMLGREVAEE